MVLCCYWDAEDLGGRTKQVKRVGFRREGDVNEFKNPHCLALSGFSPHAAHRVGSEEGQNFSQLIHYMACPFLSEDRLERTATGDILYKLKDA